MLLLQIVYGKKLQRAGLGNWLICHGFLGGGGAGGGDFNASKNLGLLKKYMF